MKKLLWIGDAACPSGFARATHEILGTLSKHYDVTVLGLNYNGDPHPYPYPIYACFPGGDTLGIGRIVWLADRVKPDVIVIQNDGWHIPFYMQALAESKRHSHVPVVAAVAVDAKNFNGAWLKGISLAIFWTQFALDEARLGGYTGPARVISLGVDPFYLPGDRRQARLARKLDQILDTFIVGNVNRNQTRKRWDLTIRYFAEWVYDGMPLDQRTMDNPKTGTRSNKAINDAWLYLHTAPTGDEGVDVVALARYYGIGDRLALMTPDTFYGITEEQMRDTYRSFDVQMTTTQGEGFGLTTFEGMACGVPQIVPDWSALGELCNGAVRLVPCTSTALNAVHSGTIGGVADEAAFVAALDDLYRNQMARRSYAARGMARAREARFRWPVIGQAWLGALGQVLGLGTPQDTPQDGLGSARGDERAAGGAIPFGWPNEPSEAEQIAYLGSGRR